MGRRDITLQAADRPGLAGGLYAATPVLTALGWQRLADLHPGDLLPTRGAGLVAVHALRPVRRTALWSVRIPPGALANNETLLVPPGQPLLIETELALP